MNAYVLVGGRSRRIGASKSALFLDRVAAAAGPVFDEVIAVQRAGGQAAPALRTIFEEPHEEEGAIFGIACALRDGSSRCFILAVDYPLITTDVLRFLRDRGGVPVWNGVPQPLCAVWDPAVLRLVERRIAEGRYDVRSLIGKDVIDESELRARFAGEPLMNVNTPEELEAAERSYGR